uniref:Uncharacterized protein n=1 Tax=Glossina palpalis gambiensis TaxID=67801 RepID=A0A1B0AQA0_9MUSC
MDFEATLMRSRRQKSLSENPFFADKLDLEIMTVVKRASFEFNLEMKIFQKKQKCYSEQARQQGSKSGNQASKRASNYVKKMYSRRRFAYMRAVNI